MWNNNNILYNAQLIYKLWGINTHMWSITTAKESVPVWKKCVCVCARTKYTEFVVVHAFCLGIKCIRFCLFVCLVRFLAWTQRWKIYIILTARHQFYLYQCVKQMQRNTVKMTHKKKEFYNYKVLHIFARIYVDCFMHWLIN